MHAGGVVAAGHPLTAEAGARVLREGGNAVDAAIAAVCASFVCEPLLSGLGAGGYLLTTGFDRSPTLLDFFVAASGLGGDASVRAELLPIDVSFGDARQIFNVGAASAGAWGTPAGICEAVRRWGSVPLADLAAPAARMAREGVPLGEAQAYVFEILEGILLSTPEAQALFAPSGRALRAGETFRFPELADGLERLAADGAAPFYTGDVADAVVRWLEERGGVLTRQDLAAYGAIPRRPVRTVYRKREVFTNPPPNAGGLLIALALSLLDGEPGPVGAVRLVEVMEKVQTERTGSFVAGLDEPGFAERFLSRRVGSTTHVSVVDREGRACAVTCTNGEGSGVVVPGTGVHVNNIMGEEDLNPLGFHAFAPGRRMPSMMAPTIVLGENGAVELVVGSAGSNRIRSAIVQTVLGVIDSGLDAQEAVDEPRIHFEDGTVYVEPGIDATVLRDAGRAVVPFRARNLFFGGAQAVVRDPRTGFLTGGGDPRRGGAVVTA